MFVRLFTVAPLFHLYVALRLLPDLPFGSWGVAAGGVYLLLSALLIPLAMLARRMPHPRAELLAWAGFLAMGAFSSLVVLTFLRDLALAGAAAAGLLLPHLGPSAAFRAATAWGVPLLAAVLTLVGLFNARRRAPIRNVDVPIAGLPAPLHGFTIAQITDLHVGPTIRRRYVEKIVAAVNGLQADMIAVTGDLVDGALHHLAPHTAPLARLSARHGSFFVTGNHEYYSGAATWLPEFRRLGMRVLLNEHVVLEHGGASLVVAGVTDTSSHHFEPSHRSSPAAALAGAPAHAGLRLLLAHQPRSAFDAARAGFDLQLSGHTHGGQFLPWTFVVARVQPFAAGLHRLGGLWIYTSRGTGYWGPPMRLGSPSEITRVRLVAA